MVCRLLCGWWKFWFWGSFVFLGDMLGMGGFLLGKVRSWGFGVVFGLECCFFLVFFVWKGGWEVVSGKIFGKSISS